MSTHGIPASPLLIKCESCGHQFSERAKKCPKCGWQPQGNCQVCSQKIPRNSSACPECGDPEPFIVQGKSNSSENTSHTFAINDDGNSMANRKNHTQSIDNEVSRSQASSSGPLSKTSKEQIFNDEKINKALRPKKSTTSRVLWAGGAWIVAYIATFIVLSVIYTKPPGGLLAFFPMVVAIIVYATNK